MTSFSPGPEVDPSMVAVLFASDAQRLGLSVRASRTVVKMRRGSFGTSAETIEAAQRATEPAHPADSAVVASNIL